MRPIDVNRFLKEKSNENQLLEVLHTLDLYDNIPNQYLKNLFAILHQELNRLFKFMYSKTNGHYNADQSRELLHYIKLYKDMEYVLKNTTYSFCLNNDYKDMIVQCSAFLRESNGSAIPDDLLNIQILEYEPIFSLAQIVNVRNNDATKTYSYHMKLIGEGSYAHVFKYYDEFYKKTFVLKRAKKDLNAKEIERFKKEYQVMKEFKSPYILDVYSYDDEKNEYYMEYADETLYDYITTNNTKISKQQRKSIANQIFRAFSYIHSKEYLHRDISLTNVLLFHFDDVTVAKVADFGLVKDRHSNLTSFGSEIKGSLNDSNLAVIGFNNYSIEYETFALTRLIWFLMTGKHNVDKIYDDNIKQFVMKGINADIKERYHSIDEFKNAFNSAF